MLNYLVWLLIHKSKFEQILISAKSTVFYATLYQLKKSFRAQKIRKFIEGLIDTKDK